MKDVNLKRTDRNSVFEEWTMEGGSQRVSAAWSRKVRSRLQITTHAADGGLLGCRVAVQMSVRKIQTLLWCRGDALSVFLCVVAVRLIM